jgi:argininosuccinate lyase
MPEKKYLWSVEQQTMSEDLMAFMAGSDIKLDKHLFVFDIQATQAHIGGLKSIEIITQDEYQMLYEKLVELKKLYVTGDFKLYSRFEDGHSAIEFFLTDELGDLGKKSHTGRSRNDQVLTCTRLFMKHHLLEIKNLVSQIADITIDLAQQHQHTLMPGYTHLQRAMPNTVAVWLLGFAEAMLDDGFLIDSTLNYINSSPLGTAAGFGVPLDLPRQQVAEELGFDRVQINPVYAQNSRGKFELVVLQNLYQVMLNLRRFSWDLSLFMTHEFGFISLDKSYTTGSSIMPNKANPDVVELMRASISQIEGAMAQIQSILSLPSGYQRDLQMTKEPIIKGVLITQQVLSLVPDLIKSLKFNKDKMSEAISPEMMATDQALQQVKNGVNFRDAYGLAKVNQTNISAAESIQNRISLGGASNLGLKLMRKS